MAENKEIFATIIVRGGTTAEWAAKNPILAKREIGAEEMTDGRVKLKVGDGVTHWADLPYDASDELADLVQDATHRTVTDDEKATWNAKQDALTFDATPTEGSTNPVTSGGVKDALDEVNESIKAITGGGVVSGVKGAAEDTYRVGNVNITPENIGLGNVDNTADVDKPVSTAQQTALDAKADKSEIPDVSEFITKTVNDLTYYYTKTEIDGTVSDLEGKISAIPKFAVSVVSALPTSGISETTIYLLKTSETESGNLYTEYIYTNGAWESLGTQTLDLSAYATTAWVSAQIADFLTESDVTALINTALAAYVKSADLAAIATSGKLADATEDSTHRVVTDAEKAAWNAKQSALTFDETPTANSENPVKSGGVKTELDKKANDADLAAIAKSGNLSDAMDDATHRTVTDAEKAAWNAKQAALTFDTTPTAGSVNPVTSGGVKTALDAKANASDVVTESTGLSDSADLMRYSDTITINGGGV